MFLLFYPWPVLNSTKVVAVFIQNIKHTFFTLIQ